VCDAKATFLLAQHKRSGLNGGALALGSGKRSRLFKTVL
jgi:hypothetical protein